MLFLGPCIDNLGCVWSLYVVAGSYIILPENSHKNLNCTNGKTTVKKESKTSPSCSETTKMEFKTESIVE